MTRLRTTFTLLVAAVISGFWSANAKNPTSLTTQITRGLTANVPDGFTVAAVGDIQAVHPFFQLQNPSVRRVLHWVRSANIAVGNLETSIIDARHFTGYPQATRDSLRPIAVPALAVGLKKMGFDLLARANNHATDWSITGMSETDRRLDEAGIVHAGTGDVLGAARAPRYLDTPWGRIAFVSFTTTFEDTSVALQPLGELPGRPGVSALRSTRIVLVDHKAMNSLRRILAAQPKGSTQPAPTDSQIDLFGTIYEDSDHFGRTYEVNRTDESEILRAVRQGKLSSDFLVVNVHSHEPGNWSDTPVNFLPTLAHKMIDDGADIVSMEGPHHLRGIEIYKGKPIFYSLGNFTIQFAPQEPVAVDMYEKLSGNPKQITAAELNELRIGPHVETEAWYQSVVAVSKYKRDRLSEVILHPIELDLRGRIADRGIPYAAVGAEARKILENLADLSKPFGTTIRIEGDIGVVSVAGNTP